MYRLLVINPGSTSTKISVFHDREEVLSTNIEHEEEKLAQYEKIVDQQEFRTQEILTFLKNHHVDINAFDTVVGRGGMLPPVNAGAYEVNEAMIKRLRERPLMEHAANLGALIADEIAQMIGVKAYIYDSTKVDEMTPIARISGMPALERKSTLHTLNSRAVAMRAALDMSKSYQELNLIVAHMGGGISVSIHEKGRIIDLVSDDEGPFSPTRAGRLHVREVIHHAYSGISEEDFTKMFSSESGLKGYLGTADAREVESMIQKGDQRASLVYQAMAYQVAKAIGELGTTVSGQVDAILLTGGIAYSDTFTNWIKDRVSFIGPVKVYPGEHEMKALAQGAIRVLDKEEEAKLFQEE